MQTYLKTKPIFIQLLLFIGMAMGIMMVLFLIGGWILSEITGISILEMGNIASMDPKNPNMLTIIRGMLLLQFLGLFFIPPLLFAYFSDPRPLNYIGLRPPYKAMYWILGIAVMLVAVPMVEYIGLINRDLPINPNTRKWVQSMEDEAARTLQVMLGDTSLATLILNIIFIAAFAGIGEELFFRGIIQRLFIKATRSPWAGIIIAALLFSFFHFQFFGFIPRFLLGALLGAIYWYSGSIWPAIVAHFVYDAFFIILAYFNPQLVTDSNAHLVNKSYLAVSAAVSAILVAAIVWMMKKNSKADYHKEFEEDLDKPSEKDFTF